MDDEIGFELGRFGGDLGERPFLRIVAILQFLAFDPAAGVAEHNDALGIGHRKRERNDMVLRFFVDRIAPGQPIGFAAPAPGMDKPVSSLAQASHAATRAGMRRRRIDAKYDGGLFGFLRSSAVRTVAKLSSAAARTCISFMQIDENRGAGLPVHDRAARRCRRTVLNPGGPRVRSRRRNRLDAPNDDVAVSGCLAHSWRCFPAAPLQKVIVRQSTNAKSVKVSALCDSCRLDRGKAILRFPTLWRRKICRNVFTL